MRMRGSFERTLEPYKTLHLECPEVDLVDSLKRARATSLLPQSV
jgi:hypothetical protein